MANARRRLLRVAGRWSGCEGAQGSPSPARATPTHLPEALPDPSSRHGASAMTAEVFAWAVLFVALCGASLTALIIGGKYIVGRLRRWDYPDEFTPAAAEMARRHADLDACAELDEVIDELAEALAMLRERSVAA